MVDIELPDVEIQYLVGAKKSGENNLYLSVLGITFDRMRVRLLNYRTHPKQKIRWKHIPDQGPS